MKFKKKISLMLAAMLVISSLSFPAMADNVENVENVEMLFSDDFEQYTQPESGNPLLWGDGSNMSVTYDNDYFKYTNYAGVNTAQKNDTYNPFMTEGTLAKHIQFVEGKNVGSGKSMTVTSQGFIDYAGIIKQSNITKSKLNDKKLIFSIDFDVNRMFIGEGYGVWLSEFQDGKVAPDQMENRTPQAATKEEFIRRQLIAVAPEAKGGRPQIYAFGQKIGEAELGTAYSYTLELTPNGNGGYKAAAELNGTKLANITQNIPTEEEIAGCKYVTMSPIIHKWTIYDSQFGRTPTDDNGNKNYQNDIDIISLDNLMLKTEQAPEIPVIGTQIDESVANTIDISFINEKDGNSIAVNPISAGDIAIDNNASISGIEMHSDNTGIKIYLTDTNAGETYNISFTVSTPDASAEKIVTLQYVSPETKSQEVFTLFSDDFEDYPVAGHETGIPLVVAKDKKSPSYDTDEFTYASIAGVWEKEAYEKFMTAGTLEDHIKFEPSSGFGSGNVMKVISQGFVNYAGMVKRSNFTSAKIADKDIVFSVDLNVNRMFLGEGYGIWLANANGNDEIDPLQTEDWYPAKLTTGEMTNGKYSDEEIAYRKKQLMTIAPTGWTKVDIDGSGRNSEPIAVYAFGQKVGEVTAGVNYNYRLELIPDGKGGYSAQATLTSYVDGVEIKKLRKIENTDLLPNVTELTSYTNVMMSPMVHLWNITAYQLENTGTYENGKEIIKIDNLAMYSTKHFELDKTKGQNGISNLNSYGEISVADKKFTLNMSCELNKSNLDISKFEIDNGAVIKNVSADGYQVNIELDNIKPSTEYKINVGGIFNAANCEYTDEFTLKTSNGVDVAPIKLNDDNQLNIGTDNKVEVTIHKQDGSGSEMRPAVFVIVYSKSGDDYMWKKTYCPEPQTFGNNTSIIIDDIEISQNDRLCVYVWNDLTQMNSLTSMVEFK